MQEDLNDCSYLLVPNGEEEGKKKEVKKEEGKEGEEYREIRVRGREK